MSSRVGRGILAVAVVLGLAREVRAAGPEPTTTQPASAASPEPPAEVREAVQHFERGVALFEDGDYRSALYEFERAHELSPNYRVLYNIGVTQILVYDYASGQATLERYLAEGGSEIPPDRLAQVREELTKLQSRIGVLVVDSETEGAEVEIDGRSVGHTPLDGPVRLNVGSHVVVITAPDRGPFRRKVEVVGGRQQELVVPALAEPDLSPAKALEPASTSAPAPAPLETRRSPVHVRRAAWAMLGVTAALGTAALVTGILTVRAEKRFDDALDEYPGSSGEIDDRSRRARGLAAATDALIGTAVVAASVTIGLAIAARKTTKRRRAAASIVGGTGLRVRF